MVRVLQPLWLQKIYFFLGNTPPKMSNFENQDPKEFSSEVLNQLSNNHAVMSELYSRWVLAEAQVEEFKKANAFSQNHDAKELKNH
jgi:hypothetical protein